MEDNNFVLLDESHIQEGTMFISTVDIWDEINMFRLEEQYEV